MGETSNQPIQLSFKPIMRQLWEKLRWRLGMDKGYDCLTRRWTTWTLGTALFALVLTVLRARARRARLSPGVTVVIVNFNTLFFLRATISAIRHFSAKNIRILVVDNHSDDGSQAFFRNHGIQSVRLPCNMNHGPAMDIGFLLVRTEFAVAMDVDAFPISHQWLSVLRQPLECGYAVSGAHTWGRFVHPCCLVMRTRDFIERNHTFIPNHGTGKYGVDQWDVGQLISMREGGRVFLIERSAELKRGAHPLGTVFGGIVYHNWFSVRPTTPDFADYEPLRAWEEAKRTYLRHIPPGEELGGVPSTTAG